MQRDSSAAFTAKLGFSVVAPTSDDGPVLDVGQERVLLGLVEPMNLVDEHDRALPVEREAIPRRGDDLAQLADAPQDGAERHEVRSVAAAMTRASVVLPLPGGPQRIIERTRSLAMACVSSEFGAKRCSLPDERRQRVAAAYARARGAAPSRRPSWRPPRSSVSRGVDVRGAALARPCQREPSAKRAARSPLRHLMAFMRTTASAMPRAETRRDAEEQKKAVAEPARARGNGGAAGVATGARTPPAGHRSLACRPRAPLTRRGLRGTRLRLVGGAPPKTACMATASSAALEKRCSARLARARSRMCSSKAGNVLPGAR